jgi:Zn-dependent protease with chaperone function
MTWRLVALVVASLPGLFAWWSGRQLLCRLDDAALPERLLRRQGQQQALLYACTAAAMLAVGRHGWIIVPFAMVAAWVGDLPSRRVLFDERWSLVTYLGWQARVTAAWSGFWILLALAPIVIHEVEPPLGVAVAVVAAAVIVTWNHRYAAVFVRLVGARPVSAAPSWEPVLQRARVPRPRLYELPVPGGRFVNAVALPAAGSSAVLLSQSLLESFDADEQAAVLAHELAHLEAYDAARRRRISLAGDAIAVVSTVGLALAVHSLEDALSGRLLALLWFGALLGGAIWWAAAHKSHEMESDARAVVLCGDVDAVVRALAKLTVLSALPRRWSLEFEAACSHPSVARRIAHVRRVAGVGSPRLDAPLAIAASPPGTFLLFEPDRLVWLDGVPADCPRTPAELCERGVRSRAVPYSALAELRVVAGAFRSARLVAADTSGRSWSTSIEPAELPGLQAVLDRTDTLLAQGAAPAIPRSVARVVGLLLAGVVVLGQAAGAGMLAAAIGLLRPGRAALAGIAAVAVSGAILTVDRLARTPPASRDFVGLGAAVLVAAGAIWLSTRRRSRPEPLADLLVPIGAYAIAAGLAWTPLLWDAWHEGAALALGTAIHRTPATWITGLALVAALLAMPYRMVRAMAGCATLAILVAVGAVSIADRRSVAAVTAVPGDGLVEARVVATHELPRGSRRLSSSPSGRRVAVALPGTEGRWVVMGRGAGDRMEIRAEDLEFVDEDRLLVVAAAGNDAHAVRMLDLGADAVSRAPISIGRRRGPLVRYGGDGAWAVFDADASRSFEAAFGRLDDDAVTYGRWHPSRVAQGAAFRVWAVSPERAVLVVTSPTALSRTPWGPLVYWRSGQPMESRVWLLENDASRHLATWPGQVRCRMPSRAPTTLLCVGWRGWEGHGVVTWRLDLARESVGPPLDVAGDVWSWGISDDGRRLAMQARDVVTILDLDRRSVVRHRLERIVTSVTELLPTAGGLAMLATAGDATVLTLHETR